MHFKNRRDAGLKLAQLLTAYKGQDVIVYALPRGGITVAAEIASRLHAPLDVILAHKIGHPFMPEYAIAAVSESGHLIGKPDELKYFKSSWLEKEKEKQMLEIKRRRALYRQGKKEASAKDKIAILVDDGIATGLTMQVGIQELRNQTPQKIIVAVPVSPKNTAHLIQTMADEFVALEVPDDFMGAVGAYYDDFSQVEDEEVAAMISQNQKDLEHFKDTP
jgi:putative phosphoribosyl transferase